MRENLQIIGRKGEQPTEIEDTIQTSGNAYVVDLICHGEIEGLVDPGPSGFGDISGRKTASLFLDETPYTTDDFPTVRFDYAQDFRVGIPFDTNQLGAAPSYYKYHYASASVPIPTPQSSRLRKTRHITMAFSSTTYPDAVRALINIRTGPLTRSVDDNNKKAGETNGDLRQAAFSISVFLAYNGFQDDNYIKYKTVYKYEKSSGGIILTIPIELPKTFGLREHKWRVKIVRETEDYNERTTKITADTYLDSFVIVTDNKYVYPNMAVASLNFDAKNFNSLPQRAYHTRLLKVKVPKGYTPTKYWPYNDKNKVKIVQQEAQYPNIWDGTFEEEKVWTDNPVWIYYDIITNKTYGLGEYISEDNIDKWTLYKISKFCDELIDDGYGGLEPRFTCNMLLTETEEAFTVLTHLGSIFRGMSYWLSNSVFISQDRPKLTKQIFTNSNVINGIFNRSSTDRNQKRTVCLVRWNDPQDFFRPKIERVEDSEGILKYGIRENQIAAFACTSKGQAIRAGLWSLFTERLESQVISFEVGYEGLHCRPGDVVGVLDSFRLQRNFGGRTIGMNDARTQVVLDRFVDVLQLPDTQYSISLQIPFGYPDPTISGQITGSNQTGLLEPSFIQKRTIESFGISGANTIINVISPFGEKYIGGTWAIEMSRNSGSYSGMEKYRVLGIEETENKTLRINGIQYDESKFTLIESGFRISTIPNINYSGLPIMPPTDLRITGILDYNSESVQFFISGDYTPSTGANLGTHIGSGKHISNNLSGGTGMWQNDTGEWQDLFLFTKDSGEYFTFNFSDTGLYVFAIQAVQMGGARSEALTGSYILNVNGLIPSGYMDFYIYVENHNNARGQQTKGYAGYDEPNLNFYIDLIRTGIDSETGEEFDDREIFVDKMAFRIVTGDIFNKYPISEWYYIDNDESFTIFNDMGNTGAYDNIISGWPIRHAYIEHKYFKVFDTSGSPSQYKLIRNHALDTGRFFVVDAFDDLFIYSISPSSYSDDFSKVYFWTGYGDPTGAPSGYPTGYERNFETYSLYGDLIHNAGGQSGYFYYALVDNFSSGELMIGGPKSLYAEPMENHTGWGISMFTTLVTDVDNNEDPIVEVQWNKYQYPQAIGYELSISGTQFIKQSISVPQPTTTEQGRIRYAFKAPRHSTTYWAKVRAFDGKNRKSDWSDEWSTYVPNPAINYLLVEGSGDFGGNIVVGGTGDFYNGIIARGKSRFEKPTYVNVQTYSGSSVSVDLNMSLSNIYNVVCDTTSSNINLNLAAGTVQPGSTYIIFVKNIGPNNGNRVDLNNGFIFPDSEVEPNVFGGSDIIISCVSKDSVNSVYAVINRDFE